MGWYKIIWYCSKWVVDSRIWPIYFDVWISKVTLFLTWVNIMSTLHQNEDPNRGAPSSLNESRPSSHQNLFSWSTNRTTSMGSQKIRITILCARSLVKRDLFRLPDPFVKVCCIFMYIGNSHQCKNDLVYLWSMNLLRNYLANSNADLCHKLYSANRY